MRSLSVALGCIAGAVMLLASCEPLIGASFDETTTVSCNHTPSPPRPLVQNAGGSDEGLVAITSIDVGDAKLPDGTPAYLTIGFDLDNSCSNLSERPSCKAFSWAKPDITDGPNGVDNGGGALMYAEPEVFNIAPFSSEAVTSGIRQGVIAPIALLRIRNYNDRVVDDDVSLDWYVAEESHAGTRPTSPPLLDGTDEWPIWEGTVDGPLVSNAVTFETSSKFRDAHAYVTDYKLVAKLPPGTPLKLQNVTFITEGITLELTLAYNPLRVVAGVLGGLVRSDELFRKMPQMTNVFGVPTLCTNDPTYPRVKAYFCRFIDSLHDGHHDPDAPCDAISMGMRFGATIVKPGPLRPDPLHDKCPAEQDPANDSCSIPAPPL